MSKFNTYAKELDTVARDAFGELNEAKTALDRATEKRNAYPEKHGIVNAEYAAKSARAKADYVEARDKYDVLRRSLPESCNGKIEGIRERLEKSLAAHYEKKPEAIDANALALLQSGVLRPDDYANLFNRYVKESNFTMLALVGKCAADAAIPIAERDGANAPDAVQLRVIAANAKTYNGNAYREAFNYLADTLNRTMKNTSMIPHWDELTAETVDRF